LGWGWLVGRSLEVDRVQIEDLRLLAPLDDRHKCHPPQNTPPIKPYPSNHTHHHRGQADEVFDGPPDMDLFGQDFFAPLPGLDGAHQGHFFCKGRAGGLNPKAACCRVQIEHLNRHTTNQPTNQPTTEDPMFMDEPPPLDGPAPAAAGGPQQQRSGSETDGTKSESEVAAEKDGEAQEQPKVAATAASKTGVKRRAHHPVVDPASDLQIRCVHCVVVMCIFLGGCSGFPGTKLEQHQLAN